MSEWVFSHRAFQIDLARLVERPEIVLRELPRYADWGYNVAFLYVENAFRYPSDPVIWRKHSWSARDLGRYVDAATKRGIQVICCVPLFGHAGWLTRQRRQFDELREQKDGFSGQICPGADGLIEKVDQLLADIVPFNTHPVLHIGFDESPTLGKCSRCRPVLEDKGEGEIVNRHLQRMADCVRRVGKTPGIWGDMFYYYPEKIPQIPKDVVVFDWFYYPFETRPRVEQFGFREIDSAGALRRAGLRVWGCSLGNGFGFGDFFPDWDERLRNIRGWAAYGAQTGCEGQLITAWEQRNGSRHFNHAIDATAPLFWTKGRRPSIEAALTEGVTRAYAAQQPRVLAQQLLTLGRHWVCGHYQSRHVYGPPGVSWIRYSILPDEVAALRDCSRLARALPAEMKLGAATRAHIARRTLLVNRIALEQQAINPREFRQLAAEADRLAVAHTRWWKWARYGNGAGRDRDEQCALIPMLRTGARWLRQNAKPAATRQLRPLAICFRSHLSQPNIQSLQITLARPGHKEEQLGRTHFIEFRDKFTRRGCRCVRVHAIPSPADFRGGKLRLEVFPYGPIGISDLHVQQGQQVFPVNFRVLKRSGRVRNLSALTKRGATACEVGDTDPVAQTHNLKRRAIRHFVELQMEGGG